MGGTNRFLLAICLALAPVSSFAQLPVNHNLQLWFRADAGVTTNGSGNVSTWADQSSNGNDATNLNLSAQPVWIDNALNGLPVVRFDGVNDVLSTINTVNLTNGLSIFIIAKNDVRKDYNGLFRVYSTPFHGSGNSYLEIYWQAGTAGSGNPVYAVNRLTGPFSAAVGSNVKPDANNYYIYDVVAAGSAATQRVQAINSGTSSGTVLPIAPDFAHLGIGYGAAGTGGFGGLLDGDIAEVVVFDAALTTFERSQMEGFLADKYGLTIPEPGTLSYLALFALAAWFQSRRRASR